MNEYVFYTAKRRKKKILQIACWLVVILYMACIFYFSNQNGIQSNKISEGIADEIKRYLPITSGLEEKEFIQKIDYNVILRKFTHFTEYFVLALIVYQGFRFCLARHKTATLLALTFCIVYASLDEYHQSFVIERTPALKDIIIDVSGGLLALITLFFIRLIKLKIRRAH